MSSPPRLHVVTDDEILARYDFEQRARDVLEAGRGSLAFHLRGPRTDGRRLHDLGVALKEPASRSGSILVVNDRVDVTLAVGLDGVQLGRRSLPGGDVRRLKGSGVIGLSCHDEGDIAAARTFDASWVILGNVYETNSHPGRRGLGLDLVRTLVEMAGPVPVVAIGGVTPDRVEGVLHAGAWGVAVLSGVWGVGSPHVATSEYISVLQAEARGT